MLPIIHVLSVTVEHIEIDEIDEAEPRKIAPHNLERRLDPLGVGGGGVRLCRNPSS